MACNKFTSIDGKACNDIPEAVYNINLLYHHALAILVKLDEINAIPLSYVTILNKAQSFITG